MNDVLISRNEAAAMIYDAAATFDKKILEAKNNQTKEVIGDIKELIVYIAEMVEAIEPPERKPLELGMIFGGIVCIEYKGKTEIKPAAFDIDDNTYAGMVRYNQFGTAARNYVDVSTYGSFWRCWEKTPTTQEREAAPWEDEA